jgi:hypothetical protein
MRLFGFLWFGQTITSWLPMNGLTYLDSGFGFAEIFEFLRNPQIRGISKICLAYLILSIRRDSFRVFSVYEQIHSAYSQCSYRFNPRNQRMRPNCSEYSEENFFSTAFKGTLLQKMEWRGILLGLQLTRNNNGYFEIAFQKNSFRVFWLYAARPTNLKSWRIRIHIRK